MFQTHAYLSPFRPKTLAAVLAWKLHPHRIAIMADSGFAEFVDFTGRCHRLGTHGPPTSETASDAVESDDTLWTHILNCRGVAAAWQMLDKFAFLPKRFQEEVDKFVVVATETLSLQYNGFGPDAARAKLLDMDREFNRLYNEKIRFDEAEVGAFMDEVQAYLRVRAAARTSA